MGQSISMVRRPTVPTLLRVMLDFGRYTLGVIVTSAGIAIEIHRGRKEVGARSWQCLS